MREGIYEDISIPYCAWYSVSSMPYTGSETDLESILLSRKENLMMRKAYIVTAYNQIDYLNRFTDSLLADGTSDVFIHLDKKKDSLRKQIATNEHIRLIVNNLAVEWGGWSFLMAIIQSWREVIANGQYDYIILCSGQDILLRYDLDSFLADHPRQIFISAKEDDKVRRAFLLYNWPSKYFRIIDTKWSITRMMRAARIFAFSHGWPFQKRPLDYDTRNMTFYKSWFWSVIPYEVIVWILQYVDSHPDYLEVFKGFVAEEGFIATTIMMSPYRDWIKFDDTGLSQSLTFRKPSVNNHPPVMLAEDIAEAQGSGLFFARKVDCEKGKAFIEYFMKQKR